jgi:hypothetical protein
MRDLRRWLAFFALAGCVDVSRPFGRAVEPVVRREVARREEAERERVAGLPRVVPDEVPEARKVSVEDGVTHVILGSVRVDLVGNSRITTSAEATASPILQAMKGAHGWLFATYDTLYTSASFTGPLRLVGEFPEVRRVPTTLTPPRHELPIVLHRSHGRLAVTVDYSQNFSSDGSELRRHDEVPTRSMAWSGERRGARIDTGLRVYTTRDGGGSWQTLDTHGEVPVRVEGRDDALFLVTTVGTQRIEPDGALVPVADEVDPSDERRCEFNRDTSALRGAVSRAYELAPGYTRNSPTPPARDELPWHGPLQLDLAFSAHGPLSDEDARYREWAWSSRALGTLPGRVFMAGSEAPMPVVASLLSRLPPAPGGRVSLVWRSSDERGAFTRRIQTIAPREVIDGSLWEALWPILGASRAGVLIETSVRKPPSTRSSDTETERALYWLSARGARRVRPLETVDVRGFVALDDGGAVVLFEQRFADPRCDHRQSALEVNIAGAIELSPEGEVRRSTHVGLAPSRRALVGFGRLGAEWGLVVSERHRRDALTIVMPDGAERPFGAWSLPEEPHPCGPPLPDAPRLHLFSCVADNAPSPIEVTSHDDPQALSLDVSEGVFERDARGVCVRSVMLTAAGDGYSDESENGGTAQDTIRLFARDGALVGTHDSGAFMVPARAQIQSPHDPPSDI